MINKGPKAKYVQVVANKLMHPQKRKQKAEEKRVKYYARKLLETMVKIKMEYTNAKR